MKVFVVIDNMTSRDGFITIFKNRLDAQEHILSLAEEYAYNKFCFYIDNNMYTPKSFFSERIEQAWEWRDKNFSGLGAALWYEAPSDCNNIVLVEKEVI